MLPITATTRTTRVLGLAQAFGDVARPSIANNEEIGTDDVFAEYAPVIKEMSAMMVRDSSLPPVAQNDVVGKVTL